MTPHEKLAASLEALRSLQQQGINVFQSSQFTRTDRERLVKNGFLKEVMKGWLISTSPDASPGDTTPWFSSFWEFCTRYADERFGDEWHLSPQQSLELFAEKSTLPLQVIVYSPHAQNNNTKLLFGTSLYALKQKAMPPPDDLTTMTGLRVYKPEAALIKVPENFFTQFPTEAEVVLGTIRDPSDLLARLLSGGHAFVAGRLAGAFRHIGRTEIADEILSAMKAADYDVRETDPFETSRQAKLPARTASPIVARLERLWASNRNAVLDVFPAPPDPLPDRTAYLKLVDDIYEQDAYHSLSIEGYRVTEDLIQRVASGDWNPDENEADKKNLNALAARGYFQAFKKVRGIVEQVFAANDSAVVRSAHRDWYRELFAPHVAAGALDAAALAGYRNHPVYLRGSRHVPPRWEILRDAMPALFDLIEAETEPSVRAVLGHWLFGYVHPFPDGNGRVARFLMNTLLATAGYPWTIIRVEKRKTYLEALEAASVDSDITSFALFVSEQMKWSLSQTRGETDMTAQERLDQYHRWGTEKLNQAAQRLRQKGTAFIKRHHGTVETLSHNEDCLGAQVHWLQVVRHPDHIRISLRREPGGEHRDARVSWDPRVPNFTYDGDIPPLKENHLAMDAFDLLKYRIEEFINRIE